MTAARPTRASGNVPRQNAAELPDPLAPNVGSDEWCRSCICWLAGCRCTALG